jgi:hypothetical protein
MLLDRNRPYAEVIGRPGVGYEQDGRNFRPDGSEVVAPAPVGSQEPAPGATPNLGGGGEQPMPQPRPVVQEKRGPGRPRKALHASTALAAQFAGYDEAPEWVEPLAAPSARDVLAPYRDPQEPDGSMVVMPSVWVDGI